ncbi:DUF7302 family protein [Streptomyces showdoensis]|uniref:Rho termination factor N-terminal domain-containing protein n=1 Tax=Streptomyces showdoensis TaxID=68268 RepID=A0A2P2GL98_STREW|nr:hypothetical protein [Streptomyces showdoensis]KKZ72282.1 hypothetical protein VO63_19060 [Streptomyces showdoensis]
MRVEMLRLMSNPRYGNQPEGAIVDMDDADAERRIAAGDCRPVDPPKAKKPTRRAGPAEPPADPETPIERMSVEQLKTYAAEHDIDLGDAAKKADILAAVVAEVERRRDQADEGESEGGS